MRVMVEITPDVVESWTNASGVTRWSAKQSVALFDGEGREVRKERHEVGLSDAAVAEVRKYIGKPVVLEVRAMAFASAGSRFPTVRFVDGMVLGNGAV